MSVNRVQKEDFKKEAGTYKNAVTNSRMKRAFVKNIGLLEGLNPVRGQYLRIAADGTTPEWVNGNLVNAARVLESAQFGLASIEGGNNLTSTESKQVILNHAAIKADLTADPKINVINGQPQNNGCLNIPKKGFYIVYCRFNFTDQLENSVIEFRVQTSVGNSTQFVSSLGRSTSVPGIANEKQSVIFYFPINTVIYNDPVNIKFNVRQIRSGYDTNFSNDDLNNSSITILRMA